MFLLARLLRFGFICMAFGVCASSLAESLSAVAVTESSAGRQLEFREGEFVLADGLDVPVDGWERARNPNIYTMSDTGWKPGVFHTLVGRFRFDRQALDASALAIYTISTRNNFAVSVNGTRLFQNFADVNERNTPWYRPFIIPVPESLLSLGANEITIRAVSQESVGIGRVIVGPMVDLQEQQRSRYFWNITAPKAVNFAMLLLGALVFLFWLGRKQEVELLWLSVSTALWFLRNYQFFGQTAPFDIALYNVLPVYATYFASAATAAFYFCFIKLPNRQRIIAGLFALGLPLTLTHLLLWPSDFIIYIPTLLIVCSVATLGFLELYRHRNMERGVLAAGMMMTPSASFYDLFAAIQYGGEGFVSYTAVLGGLFYAIAFLVSFGRRALDALIQLEVSNEVLEQRVMESRAELAASEQARQELVVAQALADERGRLMQEMHDGIGSNLITALAVARQQNQPSNAIKTLNRALGDLKLTVDSLEPVEGDLATLIGNLRHRMANDLLDANIVCRWEVESCRPIPWLDATSSLHVLRIYNEAIGNTLAHSDATEMRIGCGEAEHNGVKGISTYVADNGRGFDPDRCTHGKGLASMRARAKSLHGVLNIESELGCGVKTSLWLPYEQPRPSAAGTA